MARLWHITAKALALMAAIGGIAAITWGNVVAAGGLATHKGAVLLATAGILVVVSLIVGHCWSHGRKGLATLLAVAVLGIEAHNVHSLVMASLSVRETARLAGTHDANLRGREHQRLADAQTVLASIEDTSPRLERALAAKAAADAAVIERAAQRGCASNCRDLLAQQVSLAQAEIDAARSAIAARRRAAEAELDAARAAVAALSARPVASGSALAAATGLSAAADDVVAALLFSVPINLACVGLLMFVGHGHAPPPGIEVRPVVARRSDISPAEHGRLFAVSMLTTTPAGRIGLDDLHGAYLAWCRREGVSPLGDDEFGDQIAEVCRSWGVTGRLVRAKPVLIGVTLA